VGDIDQTIYTWRGATIENLLEFDHAYPSAKTIILEHNYRSTGTIVEASNAIIEQNKNRKEKKSVTDNPVGEHILLHSSPNAEGEARWIAEKIKTLMRAGEKPETIAILYRTNFQSRALEEGMLRSGVPYKLLGTRYFERKEVKDALAWVRLALDPARETDKMRAAQSPPRGLGKVTLGKLAAGKLGDLRAADIAKIEKFERVIAELSAAAETLLPSEFIKLMIEKSGMQKAMSEEGGEEDRERFENVQELATLASRHDGMPGKDGISAFLGEAALASDQDEIDRKNEKRGITMMTVHAAKGLEFDTVFVTGMEQGLFPHEGQGGENDRDEEEERRLFYVAMTRAKKRLILTMAYVRKIYGIDSLSEPSSFLRDISQAHMVYDDSYGDERIIE
jgi:DNA helicase-2/ATP-dependent DNA helicase PcrA